MMDRTGLVGRFRANLVWVLGLNAITGLANLVAGIWFARTIGVSAMGIYAIIVVAVHLATALFNAGFNQAVIREPEDSALYGVATTATVVQAVLAVLAIAAGYVLYALIDPEVAKELLWPGVLLMATYVLTLFTYLFSAPIEAGLSYGYLGAVRLAATLIGIGVGCVIAIENRDVYTLVARDVTASVVWFVLVAWRTPRRLSFGYDRVSVKRLWMFSRKLWYQNVLERAVFRLDYAMVGVLLGRDAMGIYYAVRGIAEGALGFVVAPIQTIVYSLLCRLSDHGPVKFQLKWWAKMLPIGAILGIGIALFTGKWVVANTLGGAFLPGASLLPGLVLYAVAVVWFESVKAFAMSVHLHEHIVTARMIQLFGALVISGLLIWAAGIAGAGWGAGISAGLMAFTATWLVVRATENTRGTVVEIRESSHERTAR